MFWRLRRNAENGKKMLEGGKEKSVSIESHTGTTKSITHCFFFPHYVRFPFPAAVDNKNSG
jgi:hypothetical protein